MHGEALAGMRRGREGRGKGGHVVVCRCHDRPDALRNKSTPWEISIKCVSKSHRSALPTALLSSSKEKRSQNNYMLKGFQFNKFCVFFYINFSKISDGQTSHDSSLHSKFESVRVPEIQ